MARAAPQERSIDRPPMNGPRSLMRTTTLRPLLRLVTRTRVPKGRVRWAAVRAEGLNGSPLAVGLPAKPGPYHDALEASLGSGDTKGGRDSIQCPPRGCTPCSKNTLSRLADSAGAGGSSAAIKRRKRMRNKQTALRRWLARTGFHRSNKGEIANRGRRMLANGEVPNASMLPTGDDQVRDNAVFVDNLIMVVGFDGM